MTPYRRRPLRILGTGISTPQQWLDSAERDTRFGVTLRSVQAEAQVALVRARFGVCDSDAAHHARLITPAPGFVFGMYLRLSQAATTNDSDSGRNQAIR